MDIASFIRHVPDYPKPGILFYDITPLLASPEAFGDVIERMADAARPLRPTRIVAAEARGFLFAAPLAQRLGVGLAPVRCPVKPSRPAMTWNTAPIPCVCTRMP